jgi:hypothetical protein
LIALGRLAVEQQGEPIFARRVLPKVIACRLGLFRKNQISGLNQVDMAQARC